MLFSTYHKSLALVVTTLLFVSAPNVAWATESHNPNGNNGVVKIDNQPFDTHPNNEPHVGCVFQIDFYNYDEGDLQATYTFSLQQPTGTAELLSGQVNIGEDAAGGGTDLDAEVTVDLGAKLQNAAIQAHDKQGYHIKLTVNAQGSQGNDQKHKVFWVQECAQPTPSPTVTVIPENGQVLGITPTPPPINQLPATGPGSALFVSLIGIIGSLVTRKWALSRVDQL